MNKLIWENWDWGAKGEEWTLSTAWKLSVIDRLLRPNIDLESVVVEIGPGGGRWTEELVSRAKSLVGIDVSEACVRECRTRFGHDRNAELRVGSGSDLNGSPIGRRTRSGRSMCSCTSTVRSSGHMQASLRAFSNPVGSASFSMAASAERWAAGAATSRRKTCATSSPPPALTVAAAQPSSSIRYRDFNSRIPRRP